MKDKSILFINYYFPPIHVIGSIRNYNVAINALDYFKSVKVLSTTNKYLYPKNELPTNGLKISLLPTFDYQTLKFLLQRLRRTKGKSSSKSKKSNAEMVTLLNKYPFNLLIGEGGLFYILGGMLYLLLNRKKYDYVYSSYSPHSDHFLAYFLKIINPKVKWVADFRDLPFVHIDGDLPNNWEEIPNNKYVKKADLITSVSNGITGHFERLNSNIYTLRNGISEHLSAQNSPEKEVIFPKFSLSYTGGLYGGVRDPRVIFKALKQLIDEKKIDRNDVEINYAGRDSVIWNEFVEECGLEFVSNNKGVVSHNESISLQRQSVVNILLSWATPTMKGVLTGKFYEYLFVSRPILLIINGERDEEFEDVFEELNAGVVGYVNEGSEKLIREYILRLYEEWKNSKNVVSILNQKKLEEYKWQSVAKRFFKEMKNLN